jgi:hypothetical protein
MSEPKTRQDAMDHLLRQAMAAPVPVLSQNFHPRLSREMRRRSQAARRFHKILLSGYGGVSAMTSAWVMRGQGLDWSTIAVLLLAPLVVVLLLRWLPSSLPKLQPRRDA